MIYTLQRGNIALVGSTFVQLFTRILPEIIDGWRQLDFIEGRDFWVGKFPPKRLRVPSGYKRLETPIHAIITRTGTQILLISQDVEGGSNGYNIDAVVGDEAKFLNFEKLSQETFQAIRGNMDKPFGKHWMHRSHFFITDMPTTHEGMWLLEKEKQCNQDAIDYITKLSVHSNTLYLKGRSATYHMKRKYATEQRKVEKVLSELRKQHTAFFEFTTLANIHNLGVDTIKDFKKNLPDRKFRASILNERLYYTRDLFYGRFDVVKHTYSAYDYSKSAIFDLHTERSERMEWDLDHSEAMPLDIAMDHNKSINTLVVGQFEHTRKDYRIINAFFGKDEDQEYLEECVRKFIFYYRNRKNKTVNYYHDHTSIQGDAAGRQYFRDRVVNLLQKYGWSVDVRYLGQLKQQTVRYSLFQKIWGNESNLPNLLINKPKCEELVEAIRRTETKSGRGDSMKKDKERIERDKNYPQEYAPHFTEAMDILIVGVFRDFVEF